MKFKYTLLVFFVVNNIFAQTDTLPKLSFFALGECYYSYDFANPANHEKPSFLYNHKRHNELNANLLFIKATYLEKNYRASLGVMAGNYAHYNLKSEPTWAQFISEAAIGFKLSNKYPIWLDAGILPSHIGFESILNSDCWTLTRSILAENSPYYETGIRMSYTTKNEKLYVAALLLNGWQRIQKPDFIQRPSFGLQATYKPSAKITFNYSNFIGTDKPDSLNALRHFHNVYTQWLPNSTFGVIAGFDMGFENLGGKNFRFKNWYSPVIILKQRTTPKTWVALRGEYYADPYEIIIHTGLQKGFKTFGFSANFDYAISSKLKWRIEGKVYEAKERFTVNKSRTNYSITTNLTITL